VLDNWWTIDFAKNCLPIQSGSRSPLGRNDKRFLTLRAVFVRATVDEMAKQFFGEIECLCVDRDFRAWQVGASDTVH